MVHQSTKNDILNLIRSRELILAETTKISTRPREVYKEEKNKRINNISRSSEETSPLEVSGETYPLAGGLSDIGTTSPASPSLGQEQEEVVSQEEVGNTTPTANTSSREMIFSGITAYHNRGDRGIKISINLQTPEDAVNAELVSITAELKRYDRFRELKPYVHDSAFFDTFYRAIKEELKETGDAYKKTIALGRCHARGSRSAWIADMCVFAEMDVNGTVTKIIFYYNDEHYPIELNEPLSPRQQQAYRSGGRYGNLQNQVKAPTLATLKRTKI